MTFRHAVAALVTAAVVAAIAGGCAQPHAGFVFEFASDMRNSTPPQNPGSEYFMGVCEAIRDLGPGAFMLVPGDMDPPDCVRLALDEVFGDEYAMYPVVGNHELEAPEYMSYLRAYCSDAERLPGLLRMGPPGATQTCYSFDHGDAHFAVMNQYYDGTSDVGTDGDVVDALYDWLAEDLAATNKPIVFVCGHEPIVSAPDLDCGRVRHRGDSLDKYPEHAHRFWSLLRKHGVLAYICGHTHGASVTRINGVWQIDAGHARGKGDPGAPSTFVRVHVEPDGVRCRVYRSEGECREYRLAFEEELR